MDILDVLAEQAISKNIQTFRQFVSLVGHSSLSLHAHALAFIIYASHIDNKSNQLKQEVQRLFELNSRIKDNHVN